MLEALGKSLTGNIHLLLLLFDDGIDVRIEYNTILLNVILSLT